ncbi:MAG TPA: hypothetical protein VMW17_16475 [Candidatus Binatia bacterium]|nr:hypothetical protein [Candidatus Binatia bacterium]
MRRSVVTGLVGAMQRWPVVVLLWLVGLLAGVAFLLAAGHWLSLAFDASLLTRTLAWDFNLTAVGDLFIHHGESLAMLASVTVVLIGGVLLFSIWLTAGVVRAVQDAAASFTFAEFWRRSLGLYPVFWRLWVLVMALDTLVIVAVVGAVHRLLRWLAESPNELTTTYALAAGFLVATIALLMLVTIHDHARICIVRRRFGAWRAFRWACRFVLHGDRRALTLTVTMLVAGVPLWLLYRAIEVLIPTTTPDGGVTISLLWGQVLMLGRAFIRVATFAAATELQAEFPE